MTGRRSNSAEIYRIAQKIKSKAFAMFIARGFYQWGYNSIIVPPLRLNGEELISVGSGVFMGAGCWLSATPVGPAPGPILVIGDGCSFSGSCVISAVSMVRIGREVLLARNVYIADHDHSYSDTSRAILHQGADHVGQVVVGDGSWLGQNVVVTSGVHIGHGAVVTKDVPSYSLAVGAPARVIKSWAPGSHDNHEPQSQDHS